MFTSSLGTAERSTCSPGADRRGGAGIARRTWFGPQLRPIRVGFWRQLQVGVVAVVHRTRLSDDRWMLRTLRYAALREGGHTRRDQNHCRDSDGFDHALHSVSG